MTIEPKTLKRLRERLDEAVDWGQRIEQYAADYGQLKPTQVPSLSEDKVRGLWSARGFAFANYELSTANAKQLGGLRTMTALLADRGKSLGDRFCSARKECDKFFRTQPPVILRALLILERGSFGTIATKSHTNILLKWAGKPELDYSEAASITLALENVRTLIEEWAPRVNATKIGERARIPWHLCEIIEKEVGEKAPSVIATPPASTAEIENYDKKKAMKSLFLTEIQFDEMLAALAEKKNVVLQGAPGVGKTYIAKRLAYALIGSNDPQRIEMIQFHQSYSYEDFIASVQRRRVTSI